jgi:uncharacterized protein (TIGR00255 family)
MVTSMTGFGRSKAESGPFSVTLEIKTVNHRFSEYLFRIPRQLMKLEEKMKKKINAHIHRGRVEVFVTLEGEGAVSRKLKVDWLLLEEYLQFMKLAQEKFNLKEPVSIQSLLNREDLIHIEETEAGNEELDTLLLNSLEEALLLLIEMRIHEGLELEKDVTAHLHKLEAFVAELRHEAPAAVLHYQERLTKRMQEFLNGQIDETRIMTEVAIFAEKADINEELTRLSSHIQQFLVTLQQTEPIGRKLDFLIQEMNREANTIGSKANDSTIAKKVVEIKSLLEKMKEQVQNIE